MHFAFRVAHTIFESGRTRLRFLLHPAQRRRFARNATPRCLRILARNETRSLRFPLPTPEREKTPDFPIHDGVCRRDSLEVTFSMSRTVRRRMAARPVTRTAGPGVGGGGARLVWSFDGRAPQACPSQHSSIRPAIAFPRSQPREYRDTPYSCPFPTTHSVTLWPGRTLCARVNEFAAVRHRAETSIAGPGREVE